MLVTEGEARMKTCPMSRNKEVDDPCIGSQCMAWRWEDGKHAEGSCGMAGPSDELVFLSDERRP
jgi:hypothetical protein